ncbi:MAG: 2-oxoisovalerate dehydrogenase [Mucilaginibacter sp.]|nr:2-oxoisovalerate dehydrogenase [Mucilaginibacter sp.]
MNEILFLVEEAIEGGFNAKAIGESIFTQADTLDELNLNIANAIQCHFDNEVPGFVLKFVNRLWS